jgi:hypothetical protein
MPHDGSITPADLVGKLDWLVLSCEKCGREGRYKVARLVKGLGADAKLTDWLSQITADCPKKRNIDMSDRSLPGGDEPFAAQGGASSARWSVDGSRPVNLHSER